MRCVKAGCHSPLPCMHMQHRIRAVTVGFHGSAHDSRVHNESPLKRQPERFFRAHEYVGADSAFACSCTCIPMYKKPRNGRLGAREKNFNTRFARGRVRCEHCFGVLKGKWQSLKGMRLLINNESHHERCAQWVVACMVLHNLVLEDWIDDAWLQPQPDPHGHELWDDLQVWEGREDLGKRKRDVMRDHLWVQ